MTEHDANRLKAVECATGEIEWAWRGELIQWQQKNDDNTRDVLRLNLATRNLRTLPWFHHHPIDLVFESNEYFRRKLGVTPGRQLTLFSFCQDQNRPERRPLERLDRKRHREIAIEPPFPTLNAAIDSALALERPPEAARRVLVVPPRPVPAPRASRVITGPLNRLELQLRESERIAVRDEHPERQRLLTNVAVPVATVPVAAEAVVAAETVSPEPMDVDAVTEPVVAQPAVTEPVVVAAQPVVVAAQPVVAQPVVAQPVVRPIVPVAGPEHVNRAFQEISSIERRLRRADPDAEPVPLVTPVSALADSSYPQRLAWQLPAVQALAGIIKASAPAEEDNDQGGESVTGGRLAVSQQEAWQRELGKINRNVEVIERAFWGGRR